MRTLHAIFPAAIVGCLLAAPAAFAANGEGTKVGNLSADEPAKSAQNVAGGSIVRTIVGLAIVLGVIYGLHWVLKQAKASKDSSVSGAGLETLATLTLGTNRTLHLVRAGREVILLGAAEHSITPISRYSEDDARALGLIEDTVSDGATYATYEAPPSRGFMNILRSKTVVK